MNHSELIRTIAGAAKIARKGVAASVAPIHLEKFKQTEEYRQIIASSVSTLLSCALCDHNEGRHLRDLLQNA